MTHDSDDDFTVTFVAYSVWRDRLYRVLRHWPWLYQRVTGYYPGPVVAWSDLQGNTTEIYTAAPLDEKLNAEGRRRA